MMNIQEAPTQRVSAKQGLLAISPVLVFLLMYVVVSIIVQDFYKMPFAVALLAASAWGIIIYRGHPLMKRFEVFSRSAGHFNIIYMIWIFVLAGGFASVAREIGAVEATVNFTMDILPPAMVVPGLFLAACFISLSVGTSVGTVVALSPLAVEIASVSGENLAFYVAVVLGGAFFGDNLSFISDTTIAATRSQGCDMIDKFKANIWIAAPAAFVTLAIYTIMSVDTPEVRVGDSGSFWMMLPYIVVIVTAIMRMNVTIVLSLGLLVSFVMGLINGAGFLALCSSVGNGIDSMGNLIIVTLLAAGMLGVIKEAGGIHWILQCLTSRISGVRGAQTCVALLVSIVNLCTANNTVAIITVGSISREISERYSIDPRKCASILDTCSCIIQCLIPYGAQTLLATSLAGISPAEPFRYLYYPWVLGVFVALSIIFRFPRPVISKNNSRLI